MRVGDRFIIHTLNQTLTYEVDQITVILPEEIEALAIVPGEDLVTLMTCTPYAINTHRLLVRGRRVAEDEPEATSQPDETEAQPMDTLRLMQNVVLPATAAVLFVVMIVLLLRVLRSGRRKR